MSERKLIQYGCHYYCFRCKRHEAFTHPSQFFVCYASTRRPERCYCDHTELQEEINQLHFICTVCIKKLERKRFQFVRDHMEMSKAADRLMRMKYRPY
jgi:hypothetical protein